MTREQLQLTTTIMILSQNSQRPIPVSDYVKNKLNLEQFVLGQRYTEVSYQAPPTIREKCQEQQIKRHEKMKQEMAATPALGQLWLPDDQDIVDEQRVFIARDMV